MRGVLVHLLLLSVFLPLLLLGPRPPPPLLTSRSRACVYVSLPSPACSPRRDTTRILYDAHAQRNGDSSVAGRGSKLARSGPSPLVRYGVPSCSFFLARRICPHRIYTPTQYASVVAHAFTFRAVGSCL